MAIFPDGVRAFREKENLPGVVFDPNNKKTLYANDMIALEEEVRAIEATLLTPAGRRMPIVGTGFPNGVVTAPVGAKYIDTNATNGAVEWIKRSDTGNTGWVVSVGDTGWRNVSSLLMNGWTATFVQVRRLNSEVYFRGVGMNTTSATANQFFKFPAGFVNGQFFPLVYSKAAVSTTATNGFGNVSYSGEAVLPSTVGFGWTSFNFATTDAWPTTLPGTAV